MEALWGLVWSGLVTNDTFAPLRALTARKRARAKRPGRAGRSALPAPAVGRWSLVSALLSASPTPTERAHARALLLLERYGIVSRDAASVDGLPGGFTSIYPVYRAMEESGRLRRACSQNRRRAAASCRCCRCC